MCYSLPSPCIQYLESRAVSLLPILAHEAYLGNVFFVAQFTTLLLPPLIHPNTPQQNDRLKTLYRDDLPAIFKGSDRK